MASTLDVNTDACVTLTDRLERLNRSAFPVAVRQTLNQAAFDVKQVTLPKSAANNFTRRSPNFFKTFSAVNKATGWNVNTMKSEVGMSDRGKVTARTAIQNMEKQEHGGMIDDGADYLKDARSGSNKKRVAKRNYYDKNNVIRGNFARGGTSKSRFVAAAFAAQKHGKVVSFKSGSGRYVMRVTSIKKSRGGDIKIKSKLLIKSRRGKPVKITPTHFSREAAMATSKKVDMFYQKEAEKQFKRALKL